jgi:hypothetical protein
MADERKDLPTGTPVPPAGRQRRIETQIHRRKKAKGVPPFEAEWDAASGTLSKELRMSRDQMKNKPDRAC